MAKNVNHALASFGGYYIARVDIVRKVEQKFENLSDTLTTFPHCVNQKHNPSSFKFAVQINIENIKWKKQVLSWTS